MKSMSSVLSVILLLTWLCIAGMSTAHAQYRHDQQEIKQLIDLAEDESNDDKQLMGSTFLKFLLDNADQVSLRKPATYKRTMDPRTNIATLEKLIPLYMMFKNKEP